MQTKKLLIGLVLFFSFCAHLNAQYDKQDTVHKKWFLGSTMFLLGNIDKVNPPNFAQLNLGYRLTGKDVVSLEFITWKYAWPLGINPIFNKSYGKAVEKFPGYIREFGIGIVYQRFIWKGLYASVQVMPMLQNFVNENGVKIDNGFHIFNTNRLGYHFKLFNNKFFIEPSIGIAGRPCYSDMPDGFKQKDDKWSKYTPEPGLHFGFNF